MGEDIQSHNQQPLTPEDLQRFGNFVQEAAYQYSMGLDPAIIQRNAALSADSYIQNATLSETGQNGRDMVAAAAAGLVSLENEDPTSAVKAIRDGGRVSEDVSQMIEASIADRRSLHYAQLSNEEKARAIAESASATVDSVTRTMPAGSHDRRVALGYLAGVFAPYSS